MEQTAIAVLLVVVLALGDWSRFLIPPFVVTTGAA